MPSTPLTHTLAYPRLPPFQVSPRWLFLRLETEQGVVGWGEPNVEGFSDTVATAVREMMPSVLGEDASRIEYLWQKLYREKFYMTTGGAIFMSALAVRV